MIYINKSVWVKKIVNLNGGPDLKECDGQNVMNFYDSLKKLVGPEIRQQNIFIRMWDTTTYEGFTITSFLSTLGLFSALALVRAWVKITRDFYTIGPGIGWVQKRHAPFLKLIYQTQGGRGVKKQVYRVFLKKNLLVDIFSRRCRVKSSNISGGTLSAKLRRNIKRGTMGCETPLIKMAATMQLEFRKKCPK